ncbi:alpha/beta fold hydrolase [Ancylobacter vacuolatus]|uniref:Polyhydroxyalkanoate synthase n=1 Tax=Ancylobacter vacuolatus TaxID=223389 RepID=A0ABU0DFL9_9HYPH|nr:alpha/beta fold hydrolase [Ancylobacter vacuolatus]MDQ0347128.1 polyhydroxyalkanoate synthase [Ancylobacter vacuolatus]
MSPRAPSPDPFAPWQAAQRAVQENWRDAQARTLDLFGYGVAEQRYDIAAEAPLLRLRHYRQGDAPMAAPGGPAVLMVPAPIKRPYVWDLTAELSVVRFCLDRGMDVFLAAWRPPAEGGAPHGLEDYARAVIDAAQIVAARSGRVPVVLGHSLGGTLAALAAALEPALFRGLVLLAAPLSFAPGSSAFRDSVAAQGAHTAEDGILPGGLLAQSCALLAPGTFVWSRWMDGALSLTDPAALDLHLRITRWALDEVPLAGRLVHEMVEWLYRDDRFAQGRLELGGRLLGPQGLRVPALAAVNAADEIGPRAAVAPFFARMAEGSTEIIEHPTEVGVGLQHLAILAGRQAHREVWPRIADWIGARA